MAYDWIWKEGQSRMGGSRVFVCEGDLTEGEISLIQELSREFPEAVALVPDRKGRYRFKLEVKDQDIGRFIEFKVRQLRAARRLAAELAGVYPGRSP